MVADITNQAASSILCIEDDEDTCALLRFVFEQEGFQVTTCSVAECLEVVKKHLFSAIILDNYFGELSGVDICREIRNLHQSVPIIFFTGEVRGTEKDKALAAGANTYLVKPNDFEILVETTLKFIEDCKTKV